MEQYNLLTDEELICRLREGHEDTRDFLMEKYKHLVRKRARAMYLIGGDSDDLIQEGMIGLYKAIRDYNGEKGASFHTFAELCIVRQLSTAVEASQRQKHQPLNSYVSIYDNVNDEKNGNPLNAVGMSGLSQNPEDRMIARERYADMESRILQRLSKFEKEVLRQYLSGLNYSEIAYNMGKTAKAVDNALQRIKKKVRQLLQEGL